MYFNAGDKIDTVARDLFDNIDAQVLEDNDISDPRDLSEFIASQKFEEGREAPGTRELGTLDAGESPTTITVPQWITDAVGDRYDASPSDLALLERHTQTRDETVGSSVEGGGRRFGADASGYTGDPGRPDPAIQGTYIPADNRPTHGLPVWLAQTNIQQAIIGSFFRSKLYDVHDSKERAKRAQSEFSINGEHRIKAIRGEEAQKAAKGVAGAWMRLKRDLNRCAHLKVIDKTRGLSPENQTRLEDLEVGVRVGWDEFIRAHIDELYYEMEGVSAVNDIISTSRVDSWLEQFGDVDRPPLLFQMELALEYDLAMPIADIQEIYTGSLGVPAGTERDTYLYRSSYGYAEDLLMGVLMDEARIEMDKVGTTERREQVLAHYDFDVQMEKAIRIHEGAAK